MCDVCVFFFFFFFFNDTATTEIYTLSLHDALPIACRALISRTARCAPAAFGRISRWANARDPAEGDRKSTRLNSSHDQISYAVFCLKKKNKNHATTHCPYIVARHVLYTISIPLLLV